MAKYYVITDKFKLVEVADVFLSVTGAISAAYLATKGDGSEGSRIMNIPMTVMKGDAFKTYLIQEDGNTAWTTDDFSVYMNGVDITSDVCTINPEEGEGQDGEYVVEINIPEVTGNVYIEATGTPSEE